MGQSVTLLACVPRSSPLTSSIKPPKHDAPGVGVAYAEYNDDFWDGLDRFANAGLKHTLIHQYIPALPDAQPSLECGALVADVCCGWGGIILMLAEAFPRSRFVGYAAFAPNIVKAQANAQTAGVAERPRYVLHDATQGLPEMLASF